MAWRLLKNLSEYACMGILANIDSYAGNLFDATETNMIQPGLKIDMLFGAGEGLPAGKGIAQGIAKGINGSFAGILARVSSKAVKAHFNALEDALAGKQTGLCAGLDMNSGRATLERLRRILLAQGGGLGQLQVNEKGLTALREILMAAGFTPDQVSDLYDQLKKGALDHKVDVSDLFTRLNQMEAKTDKDDPMLDLSMLPYLQVILSNFGIDQARSDKIIADSTLAGEGVDLKQFIQGIRTAIKQGQVPRTVNNRKNNEQIAAFLADMNADKGAADAEGRITLERFVAALEKKFQQNNRKGLLDKTLAEAGARFLKNVGTKEDALSDSFSKEAIQGMLPNKISTHEKSTKLHHKSGELKAAQISRLEPDKAAGAIWLNVGMEPSQMLAEKTVGAGALSEDFLSLMEENRTDKIQELIQPDLQNDLAGKDQDQEGRTLTSMGAGVKQSGKIGPAFVGSGEGAAGKSLPAYVLHQVGRQIVRSVQENNNEIQLQLKPPHLGRLHLSLETVQDGVRVSIVAEQKSARELLVAHVDELRSALLDQGIKLEKIDVQIAFNFDQFMTQTREDGNRSSSRKNPEFQISGESSAGTTSVEELAALSSRKSDGLLDLIV